VKPWRKLSSFQLILNLYLRIWIGTGWLTRWGSSRFVIWRLRC
jgi:hypothetical protein